MTQPQEIRDLIDHALAHVEQAMADLDQVLKSGEQTVTVDGITHELHALATRLQALRDDVAARAERGA